MSSRATGIACAALVLAVFATFWPALSGGFVNWDDAELLVGNDQFRGLSRQHLAWMFTTNHAGPYQPLTWLSYAFDHALWGLSEGLDAPQARGFHATSVALHSLGACAVFALAKRLLASGWAALVAALFFALHPLRVESVAWVTERRDVLYGALLVASVLAWLRWKDSTQDEPPKAGYAALASAASAGAALALLATTAQPSGPWLCFGFTPWSVALSLALLIAGAFGALRATSGGCGGWYVLALALYVLSLLAKASGMTLPLVLVGLELAVLRRSVRAAWVEKLPFVAAAVVFGTLAYWGQAAQPAAVASWGEHTLGERLAQACFGLAFYLRKTLWPADLIALHEVPRTLSLAEPRFALSALAVLLGVAVLFTLRRRAPLVVAAFALYALLVAPMLGLTQCGPQLVADRYSYVPLLPLTLLASAALFRALGQRQALRLAALLALALAVATSRQCRVWHDSESLWTWTLQRGPESALARAGLAEALKERAFAERDPPLRAELFARAQESYEVALQREPSARLASNAAVVRLERAGLEPARAAEHRAAALELAHAAVAAAERGGGSESAAHLALGLALFHLERYSEAGRELQLHLDLEPHSAVGWSHLGVALLESGRARDAREALERAVAVRPSERSSRWYLALAREACGDPAGAVEQYREVLRLAPGHPGAAAALERLGAR